MKYSEVLPLDTMIKKLKLLKLMVGKSSGFLGNLNLTKYERPQWIGRDHKIIDDWIATLLQIQNGDFDDCAQNVTPLMLKQYLSAVLDSANLLYQQVKR